MNEYLDIKYMRLMSSKLRNYKEKSGDLINFSCPICGDSEKNKLKARGYMFLHKGTYFVKCHNCSYSKPFGIFLKDVDYTLHQQYIVEKFKEGKRIRTKTVMPHKFAQPIFKKTDKTLDGLLPLNKCDASNLSRVYAEQRQIPKKFHRIIYHTDDFKAWCDKVQPEKSENLPRNEPRMVIPFFKCDGSREVVAIQARSLLDNTSPAKYITLKLQDVPKVYGLERVNMAARNYVFEGPIDSMFIANSIAIAGSHISYKNIDEILNKGTSVMVYDNDRRNKDIIANIKKFIKTGMKVCLFPDSIKQKDVNDMILAGYTAEELRVIMDANTFKGLAAMNRLNTWKRC